MGQHAREELQVINVAPSERAKWRLQRLTARARGRPRLATRRFVAASAAAATQDPNEVISVNEVCSKRRRFHSQTPEQSHRCAAESAAAATPADNEVISVNEAPSKRRRHHSQNPEQSHVPQTHHSNLTDTRAIPQPESVAVATQAHSLRVARLELARLALKQEQCEAQLVIEKRLNQDLRAQHDAQLATERHKNQVLREKVVSQDWQFQGLLREKARLWQQVQELQRTEKNEKSRVGRGPPPQVNLNQQGLVKQIAEMECKPLRSKSQKAQAALKKKLLMKWHPDKQPSDDHAVLATSVMQEMQNRPEWQM